MFNNKAKINVFFVIMAKYYFEMQKNEIKLIECKVTQ